MRALFKKNNKEIGYALWYLLFKIPILLKGLKRIPGYTAQDIENS